MSRAVVVRGDWFRMTCPNGKRSTTTSRRGRSPRTILDELARINSADIVMPTTDGRELRIRCVVRPDQAQARLLAGLDLRLPERLRTASMSPKM